MNRMTLAVMLSFMLVSIGYALTQVNSMFEDGNAVTEFQNIYDNAQGLQFKIFTSTPAFGDLRVGEVVILSSGTFNRLLFKTEQDLFSINVSCITIAR